MISWEWVLITYLLIGFIMSVFADIGHRVIYKSPLIWPMYVAGTVAWPVVLLAGVKGAFK